MLHLALLLSFALAPAAADAAQSPTVGGTVQAVAEHGKLPWFRGTFEELLDEAAKTKKLVFMDFWTDWCGWCKRLDKDTFSDASVVTGMTDFLCYSVDAESKDGAPLAQRYGARGYPYLVFVEPNGDLRDRISGYMPPADFLREVKRIKLGEDTLSDVRERARLASDNVFVLGELMQRLFQMNDAEGAQRAGQSLRERVARGEGFDKDSAYERWRIAQLLRQAGDEAGATAQLDAVRQLQPDGQRWLERRKLLDEAVNSVNQKYQQSRTIDSTPLELFVSTDQPQALLYEAWVTRRNLETFRANEHARAGKPEEEAKARAAARNALQQSWQHCPARFRGDCARLIVQDRLADVARSTPEDKAAAVEAARLAVEASPRDASLHELLARALFVQGHADRAVTALEKAIDLAPSRTGNQVRLAEYRAALAK